MKISRPFIAMSTLIIGFLFTVNAQAIVSQSTQTITAPALESATIESADPAQVATFYGRGNRGHRSHRGHRRGFRNSFRGHNNSYRNSNRSYNRGYYNNGYRSNYNSYPSYKFYNYGGY